MPGFGARGFSAGSRHPGAGGSTGSVTVQLPVLRPADGEVAGRWTAGHVCVGVEHPAGVRGRVRPGEGCGAGRRRGQACGGRCRNAACVRGRHLTGFAGGDARRRRFRCAAAHGPGGRRIQACSVHCAVRHGLWPGMCRCTWPGMRRCTGRRGVGCVGAGGNGRQGARAVLGVRGPEDVHADESGQDCEYAKKPGGPKPAPRREEEGAGNVGHSVLPSLGTVRSGFRVHTVQRRVRPLDSQRTHCVPQRVG